MEIFWIVLGVVVILIYLINQNKSKTTDKTIIRQTDTYKTETGEVRIERTKVVDTAKTTFTKMQPPQATSGETYIKAVAQVESTRKPMQEILDDGLGDKLSKPSFITTHTANTVIEEKQPSLEQKKQCTRCRITLPFSKFSKSSKHNDGVTIWCSDCLKGEKNTKHMKWCPICKVRRKRTSYYTNNENADSLMAWCKGCWDSYKGRKR